MEAFGIVFLAASVVWIAVAAGRQSQRRKAALSAIGKHLGGGNDERSAWGELAGATVRFAFVTRGSGKHSQSWTEIDADVPAKYPLALFVQKHGWNDDAKIARGEMVDVVLGDAAFDRAFVVEAAPADVARVLLDERARRYLLALQDRYLFEITTEDKGSAQPRVRLAVRTWLDDVSEAMPAVETIAAIAGRVRDAYVAVEQAAEMEHGGSPYRPVLDDRRAREAAEARLAEVAKVDQVRTARAARQQTIAIAFVMAFVLLWLVMLAAAN